MKIKDVIEKTGLTDKAIRLYINNGLVAPSIEENYSGRKSIDFSDADVERLKNIALLRKAGFSIADIKETLSDESSVNDVVNRFIEEKEKDIQRDTEIVNTLKRVLTENLTFEKLCKALDETEIEKDMPAEDMNVSKKERIFRTVFKGFGIFNLVISVLAVIGYMIMIIVDHKYLTLEDWWFLAYFVTYGGFVLVGVLSVWVILLCSDKSMPIRKIIKISGSLLASFVILGYGALVSFLWTIGLVYDVTSSETENPENYLSFDTIVINNQAYVEENIQSLFPNIIPSYAENEKYYYRYSHGFNFQQLDVCAEWGLPTGRFESEVKEKLLYKSNKNPEIIAERYGMDDEVLFTAEMGDWKLMYFAGEENDIDEIDTYFISIFAYNTKTNTVRYIISYNNHGVREPYYLSLEW